MRTPKGNFPTSYSTGSFSRSEVKIGRKNGQFHRKLPEPNYKRKYTQCSRGQMTSYHRFRFTGPTWRCASGRLSLLRQLSLDRNGQKRRGRRPTHRLGEAGQEEHLDLQKGAFAGEISIIHIVPPAAMFHGHIGPLWRVSA